MCAHHELSVKRGVFSCEWFKRTVAYGMKREKTGDIRWSIVNLKKQLKKET